MNKVCAYFNFEIEYLRPALVANQQHIFESLVDQQCHSIPLSLKQCVCGDCGAHPDAADLPSGYLLCSGDLNSRDFLQDSSDALSGCVLVVPWVH